MEPFNEESRTTTDSGPLAGADGRISEPKPGKPGFDPRRMKARPLRRPGDGEEPDASDPVLGFVLRDDERGWISGLLEELTPRQRDVLLECCSGGSSEQIAERMGISGSTLQNHLHAMSARLGVSGRDSVARLVSVRLIRAYRRRGDGRA